MTQSHLCTLLLYVAPSGPNLDLLCVQHSGAAPICGNYSILYFDTKGLVVKFLAPFSQKNAHFGQYWKLPKVFRLEPAHHNSELYDLLMVYPFQPDFLTR